MNAKALPRSTPATAALLTPAEIAFWLGTRRCAPTHKEIIEHAGCSRAAAYRWRAFALANGQNACHREKSLPHATIECSRRRRTQVIDKTTAAARIRAALALGVALDEAALAEPLCIPHSTAQVAIRQLHRRREIRRAGHVMRGPKHRTRHVRAGAILWTHASKTVFQSN